MASITSWMSRLGPGGAPPARRRAHLPRQFDEWIWFDETRAVRPLVTEEVAGMPDTYPFGL